LLYVGNGLFASVIFVSVLYYNNQKDENADLANMISLNLKILAVSVISICIVLTLLLFVFHNDALQRTPANEVKDKTNGLDLILYTDAIIVNFLIGCFAVVMASVTAKRRQGRAQSN
jgi:Na+/H+ antiporter NhaC